MLQAGSGEEQAAPPDDGLQADEEAIASKEVEEHKLLKGRDPGAAAAGEGGIMVELVEMPAESLDSELSREFSLPITAAYGGPITAATAEHCPSQC